MMTRPNDGGGTTLLLASGDDPDSVPDSHRDIITDNVRDAFHDPAAYFSEIASRAAIPNLRNYLASSVANGKAMASGRAGSGKNNAAFPRIGVLTMWKLSEISAELTYILQLCHDDSSGRRFFRLRVATETASNNDVVFETELVSHELLKSRNLSRIASDVKLANGGSFEVDAHGVWFTPEELDALEEAEDLDAIEWCTATPPLLAPC